MNRVVVTGMGIVSSIGNNTREVSESLRNATSGITKAERHVEHGFRSCVHGVPTCDPSTILDRKQLRFVAPGIAWGAVAMREAIASSRLAPEEVSNDDTGIIVGSGGPSTSVIVECADSVRKHGNTKRIGPFAVPKTMSSGFAANLAVWHKIRGTNFGITSACSTSAHCIGEAAWQIRVGRQQRIIAGGCEEDHWSLANAFDAMGAMSSGYNDRPAVASRAFDKNRDGFVVAGGAGIVVLEALDVALKRGAPIIAEVVGYGATSDGDDMVAPSGEGAIRCMNMALKGFDGNGVGNVGYINPHGTSTPVGDPKEIAAIKAVFGDRIPPISSTKSLTGHSLGAAGAQELIYCLLMQQGRFLTESAHIEELDPEFEGVPILRETLTGVDAKVMLSNSFGFGGTNATLVVRQFEG